MRKKLRSLQTILTFVIMKVTVSEIEALEKKSAQINFALVDNRPYDHLATILKRYYEMS